MRGLTRVAEEFSLALMPLPSSSKMGTFPLPVNVCITCIHGSWSVEPVSDDVFIRRLCVASQCPEFSYGQRNK